MNRTGTAWPIRLPAFAPLVLSRGGWGGEGGRQSAAGSVAKSRGPGIGDTAGPPPGGPAIGLTNHGSPETAGVESPLRGPIAVGGGAGG